jgi:hypothetical protein
MTLFIEELGSEDGNGETKTMGRKLNTLRVRTTILRGVAGVRRDIKNFNSGSNN